ncbi:hypothetical protein BH18ACT5_BH18ACT5_18230 [soil metagenome]
MRAVTIPLLPCADIDESARFYEALGFSRTYRQCAPTPMPSSNWVRSASTGLARVILNARLGDAKGDEQAALRLLENGLTRFSDAAEIDQVRAGLYKAELLVRLENREGAEQALANALEVDLAAEDLSGSRTNSNTPANWSEEADLFVVEDKRDKRCSFYPRFVVSLRTLRFDSPAFNSGS